MNIFNKINIQRAINDLKLGIAVYYSSLDITIAPIESINNHLYFEYFNNSETFLLLNKNRSSYLKLENRDILIPLENHDITNAKKIAYGKFEQQITNFSTSYYDAYHIFKLMKLIELIPSVIITPGRAKENILSISLQDIEEYDYNLSNISLDEITKLTISGNNLAKLASFKADFSLIRHYALIIGEIDLTKPVLARIHSSCLSGDVFGSMSCDCQEQLRRSIDYITNNEDKAGIIIYLMQDGRGIGTVNKIRAYNLQHEGLDTVEANLALGYDADERNFEIASSMLKNLNIHNIKILTNNPKKTSIIEQHGIKISENININPSVNKVNRSYLKTKIEKMSHNIKLD